jgi:branched-chain amino acid transport system ATP-binding protein
LLEIQGLDAAYGNVKVLHGIDLRVSEGEIVTLIGANGAGKSTTLKCISGLLRTRSGQIRFQGQSIQGLPTHEIIRRGLVTIMEGRRLFPDLDVLENLRLGAYLCNDAKEIARRMGRVFTLFPILEERQHQLAVSFSGGEQQMIAIGRGLMAAPRLLMMDEPSLGLSPLMTQHVGSIIQAIHREGITILLIEQNANMALRLADRGYVLETGGVVMQGPTSELLANDKVRRAYLGI